MNQPSFPHNRTRIETATRRGVSLSILMPVFNEERTLTAAIDRVFAVDYPCRMELIVVDDGSTDRTARILEAQRSDSRTAKDIVVVTHPSNRGKGAAIRTGLDYAAGSHLVILDADLEYLPSDIPALLAPVLAGFSDHVFGARVRGVNACFPSFRFAIGGRATTFFANVLYDACLTDMHTCLKLIPTEQLRSLTLTEGGFGLDTEMTARLLRCGIRPLEVPVSYHGRSVAEGKKITWRDGVACIAVLTRIRVQHRPDIAPVVGRIAVAGAAQGDPPSKVLHLPKAVG